MKRQMTHGMKLNNMATEKLESNNQKKCLDKRQQMAAAQESADADCTGICGWAGKGT